MSKFRQLTQEEKDLCEKGIKKLEEQVEDSEMILLDAQLKYDKLLDYSYKKQKKEYKALIIKETKLREENMKQIEILKDQIKNGVEKKEVKYT